MTKIIVPVSGGKDSACCLLLAIAEHGKEKVTAIFNDTGWDHPVTYEYLKYMEKTLGIKIHSTVGQDRRDGTPAPDLVSLIKAQGRFPFGLGRFCTTHLKQYSLRNFYRDNIYDGVTQYEFWFGMRTQESGQRAKRYAGITADDLFDMADLFPSRYNKKLRETIKVRLPVVEWTEEQIFDYLEKNGLERNPLYYEGTNDRVGCYPCMLAGKKVQAAMFETEVGKQRLQIIRGLEKELGVKYEMHDTDQGSCEVCRT
jgi:3'-phosphoadenosine 5'-phosphosulfate sulfotransferase (PAPS reductase)/FAD synthetase